MNDHLDNQYLFRPKLDRRNIISCINEADPQTISEMRYKDIVEYFSMRFSFAAETAKSDGFFKTYLQASDIFSDVAGEQTMRLMATAHEGLFIKLYWADEVFKAFVDKFMPELMVVAGKNISDARFAPKEIEEGKVVQFVNTPSSSYVADEALRESISALPKIG